MSAKRTRPKRRASDEDVWNYADEKIIGTRAAIICPDSF